MSFIHDKETNPCYYFEWNERREWFDRLRHFHGYLCTCSISARHGETNRLIDVKVRTTDLTEFETEVAKQLSGGRPLSTSIIKAKVRHFRCLNGTLPKIKDWSKLPACPPDASKPLKLDLYISNCLAHIGGMFDLSGLELGRRWIKSLKEEERIPVEWYPYVMQKIHDKGWFIDGMAYIPSKQLVYVSIISDNFTQVIVIDGTDVNTSAPCFNIDEGFFWPKVKADLGPIPDELIMAYEEWVEGGRKIHQPVLKLVEPYAQMTEDPMGP